MRVHKFVDDQKHSLYMMSDTPNHRTNFMAEWVGVTKNISDTKNISLAGIGGLNFLGEKDIAEENKKPQPAEETAAKVASILYRLDKMASAIEPHNPMIALAIDQISDQLQREASVAGLIDKIKRGIPALGLALSLLIPSVAGATTNDATVKDMAQKLVDNPVKIFETVRVRSEAKQSPELKKALADLEQMVKTRRNMSEELQKIIQEA